MPGLRALAVRIEANMSIKLACIKGPYLHPLGKPLADAIEHDQADHGADMRLEHYGREREIAVRQRDIARLTVMSRSAVAGGISMASCELIHLGNRSDRFAGLVRVPDVKRLNDDALSEVRGRQIRPITR